MTELETLQKTKSSHVFTLVMITYNFACLGAEKHSTDVIRNVTNSQTLTLSYNFTYDSI